jgi:hypothetical protein
MTQTWDLEVKVSGLEIIRVRFVKVSRPWFKILVLVVVLVPVLVQRSDGALSLSLRFRDKDQEWGFQKGMD